MIGVLLTWLFNAMLLIILTEDVKSDLNAKNCKLKELIAKIRNLGSFTNL